ncbi:hypothetical protein N0V82_003378 [Gnomoniopsis sp. IMI 355080]|nr:hypothetical protein N0V82_003378 [Gnomoniopsis sp. IMI 355080]
MACGVVGGSTLDCNITTPAGVELTAEWSSIGQLAGQQPTYTQFNTNVSSYDSIINPNSSCEQCGTPKSADILHLGMARFGNGVYRDAQDWQDTMKAYDCTYSFCAQSFVNWSTVNGDIVDGNRSRSALNAEPPTTEFFYPFSTQDIAFPGDQTFTIAMEDHIFIWDILSSAFQSPDGSTNGMSSGNIGNFVFTTLYDSPDLVATMEKVAVSMSNRMLVNPNATTVYGGVFGEQTIIRVQWWWLSLPVFLELIATLFLAVTVTQTHKARQYPWKSSLMPLLHGRSLLDTNKIIDDRDSLEMVEWPSMSAVISERSTRATSE